MKNIVTQWAYLNYLAEAPADFTMLFSNYVDEGWEITQISTAIDRFEGQPIIVVTALLEK